MTPRFIDIAQGVALLCCIATTFLGSVWEDKGLIITASVSLVVFVVLHIISGQDRPRYL